MANKRKKAEEKEVTTTNVENINEEVVVPVTDITTTEDVDTKSSEELKNLEFDLGPEFDEIVEEVDNDDSGHQVDEEKYKEELKKLDDEVLNPILNQVLKGLEEDKELEEKNINRDDYPSVKTEIFPVNNGGKALDVLNFMTKMKQTIPVGYNIPSIKDINLRKKLSLEELAETEKAFDNFLNNGIALKGKNQPIMDYDISPMLTEIYDGIIDQIFVLYGSIITYGLLNVDILNEIEDVYVNKNDLTYYKSIKVGNHSLSSNVFDYEFSHTSTKTIGLKRILSSIRSNINDIYNISIDVKLREVTSISIGVKTNVFEDINYLFNKTLLEIIQFGNELGILNKTIFDSMWAEIYASNMTKLDSNGNPIFNEYGKVIKSTLYEKPDLGRIINNLISNQLNPPVIVKDLKIGNIVL